MKTVITEDLFTDTQIRRFAPLADRLRPQSLDQLSGQLHLLGKEKPLRQALESGSLHSMIFWGPPGTGKTTLARLMANMTGARFVTLSAVTAGVKDIRATIELARQAQAQHRNTVLFVDEVHRFNKAQQDAFLPHVEDGTITFIGATTENPSFELNNALLSRSRVYVLKSLSEDEIKQVLERALIDPDGLRERDLSLSDEACRVLVKAADGDARRALGLLEIAADLAQEQITEKIAKDVAAEGTRRFDKAGEVFYDQISALHKSMRGSAPDAVLYWYARMLDGGCDPLYIARRAVRMASEDIGNADPRALQLALNAWDTQERLGSPEGELAIAQALVYMATAPKSNAVYKAFKSAQSDVRESGSCEVPKHLRNAPTKLMKELDYGKAYRYAHDEPEGYAAGENYFPEALGQRHYYHPVNRGLEQRIAERLAHLRKLDSDYGRNKEK